MALLIKTICSTRGGFSLLKSPCYHASKTLGSSYLHTAGVPTGSSYQYSSPVITSGTNMTHESLLSARKILTSHSQNQSLILPSLPHHISFILDLPSLPTVTSLEMPTSDALLDNAHIMPVKINIEEPGNVSQVEKLAHRMLIIRKRKIKVHRRKKFKKRTRITYSRIRHARKTLKEKNLQTSLLNQMNEGRTFSPQKYAFDLLSAAYEKVELPPKLKKKKPWEC